MGMYKDCSFSNCISYYLLLYIKYYYPLSVVWLSLGGGVTGGTVVQSTKSCTKYTCVHVSVCWACYILQVVEIFNL